MCRRYAEGTRHEYHDAYGLKPRRYAEVRAGDAHGNQGHACQDRVAGAQVPAAGFGLSIQHSYERKREACMMKMRRREQDDQRIESPGYPSCAISHKPRGTDGWKNTRSEQADLRHFEFPETTSLP